MSFGRQPNRRSCENQSVEQLARRTQNGCPGLVRVEGGQLRILQPVFFATNSDAILPRSFPVLTAIANALRAAPEIRRISIEGHTDERGTREYNLALGQRRANSARDVLVASGVSGSRLQVVSYGKDRPEALGSDESAWAQNRRAVTVVR